MSDSPTSDDWAMVLVKHKREEYPVVVNCYAEHGKSIGHHLDYLRYLLSCFNVTETRMSGGDMIGNVVKDVAGLCKDTVLIIGNSDHDSRKTRNEKLQSMFDRGHINLPKSFDPSKFFQYCIFEKDFMGRQIIKVEQLFSELQSIEVSCSSRGVLSWGLKQEDRRRGEETRPRQDLYEALLLAI